MSASAITSAPKLLTWKEESSRRPGKPFCTCRRRTENHPDLADRASSETDRAIELRARDRQRKLIAKIDEALAVSRTAPTAFARRPASRSRSGASRPGRSPRSRSRRKSAMSGASKSIATTDAAARSFQMTVAIFRNCAASGGGADRRPRRLRRSVRAPGNGVGASNQESGIHEAVQLIPALDS